MADNLVDPALVDAHNQVLDFVKYPETGLPPVVETPIADSVAIQNNLALPQTNYPVQAFDNRGYPIKPITDAQYALNIASNFAKAFSNQPVNTSADAGTPSNSGDGSSTVISQSTASLKQKGYLQEKGFFGDQSLTNENKAFNNVVDLAVGVTALALTVKGITKPTGTRNKINNYYVYDNERSLLQQRAQQIASIGVVPYDVIEEFLYILITVDNYDDMYYISTVVGIPELNNRNIVREPARILSIKNLYKCGYLANGVASINMQYGTKYNAFSVQDHQSSPFSTLQNLAVIGGQPVSPEAAAIAALAGGTSAIATAGGLLNPVLSNFPVVGIATSLIGDIASQIGQITGITALFSSFGTIPGEIGKLADIALIGQFSQLSSLTSNLNSMVSSTTSVLSQSGVASMLPVVGSLNQLVRQVRDMSHHTEQLASITTLPATIGKKTDITGQMNKVLSLSLNITSLINTITSVVGAIKGPGAVGLPANLMMNKLGGTAPSGIITQLTLGQRIPPSVLYKNPQMVNPSYAGKAFFGEASSAQCAIDQVFCKRIGAFPTNNSGGATQAFGMQNFASFGGSTSLSSMVSRALLGTPTVPTSGILADLVGTKVANLANLLNVATTSVMECRRSDHSIPVMAAMSSVLVDDTKSPFPMDVHNESWKLASSVGNEVQRYNPGFLSTCSTSL